MVAFRLLCLLLLFYSTSALKCYTGKVNDQNEAKIMDCDDDKENDDPVCYVSNKYSEDGNGCRHREDCGTQGGYCCDGDLCNKEYPQFNDSLSVECVTGETEYTQINDFSSILLPTVVFTCPQQCKRTSYFRLDQEKKENRTLSLSYSCEQRQIDPCLVRNGCYVNVYGNEICCCDTEKCSTAFPQPTISVDIPRINCYTSHSIEKKEFCPFGSVCIRFEDQIGCEDFMNCEYDGSCCMQELCNNEWFEKQKPFTCTQGIFLSNGTELVPKTKLICPAGCARTIIGDTVTFRCATGECIGKADGCVGPRCCCFAEDCAAVDLYPLPPEFKDLIPILTKIERNYEKGERAKDDENAMEGGDYEQVEVIDDGSGNTRIILLILIAWFAL